MGDLKCRPTQTPDDVDLPALRERYRQERDRRLRPEGSGQYVEAADDFADFYEVDPYSPPVIRDPISDDVDVVVLGGGFAGLITAGRLKQAGIADVRIIEMAGDFGGTWYWNRYPGLQCDVESYCYLPLLEEVNYIPRERYSCGQEIYEHCQRIGRHFDLYESALFGTQVRSLRWDGSVRRWRIATQRGDDLRSRFVVMASGPFNRPKLPGIPGIGSFQGHSFHTARWDYEYTGGDRSGGLHRLGDKRVAIIGTGATAVQVVPVLARYARHLYVFQRTPSYVDERRNQPTDPDWVRSLRPGWQAARQANFHAGTFESFTPGQEDLVCDGWTEVNRNLAARLAGMGWPGLTPEQLMELHELEDYRAMERLRRRIDSTVKDRKTAEALKPWYRFLCKRPCFNDEYLPSFNRPNVTLVDVSGSKGVERITERGIVGGGVEYEVDCIIYASGYEITTEIKRRYGIDAIEGRDGRSLYDHWASVFRTLHGITSHGFPNQFFTGFIQGGVGANISAMYDQQGRHIAYILKQALARGALTVEPSQEAEEEWVRTIREKALANTQFWRECTPGYYNNEGEEVLRSHLGEPYGPGFYAFDRLLKEWRDRGDLQGLVLEPDPGAGARPAGDAAAGSGKCASSTAIGAEAGRQPRAPTARR
jgi:cyclohexanone monooxygenase